MKFESIGVTALNLQAAQDPTQTTMFRKRFEADLVRRIRKIGKAVQHFVVDRNELKWHQLPTVKRNYEFSTSSGRIDLFLAWLRREQKAGRIFITTGTRRTGEYRWSDLYIQSAYQRGVAQAVGLASSQGVAVGSGAIQGAFLRPIHADALGLLFTRVFTELTGISDFMAGRMAASLTTSMVEGVGLQEAGKRLAEVIDISIVRARRIARTEIIRAHAEATLNTFEEMHIAGVSLLAEFSTAGDKKVCQKCWDVAKRNYFTIAQARGIIPVHPNCRCSWLPIVDLDPSNPRKPGKNPTLQPDFSDDKPSRKKRKARS